ncbi:alpha/beta hydrolase protein [Rhizodiscina lignyota]|uniref:Alpha/beta hydrolase protein n=1 Tax=Rhizodiscina lignyota TaxID=1504668 RepID=A0A9P4IJP3_9PEZI|nr:alpha/beta hydrolase protein [Rhizodiscina lignyota]
MSQNWPAVTEGDYIVKDFRFNNGSTLPELKLHYRTLGKLKTDQNGHALNAVLIMHGTSGSGAQFLVDHFAGKLFNPGQLLDANTYFLIIRDGIGHGGSSKPSDGLRAKFPRYGYRDMVRGDYELLTKHLGVDHLRLVMGTSMGGMHSWLWGSTYPDFMDAVMPLASLPAKISGRNRMTRKMAMDAIKSDPEWQGGDYPADKQPRGLITALYVLVFMSSCPLQMQVECPDRETADAWLDAKIAEGMKEKDANNLCFAFDASHDYDPPVQNIKAPLLAVNFADDQVNPPELGIFERETMKIARGKAILMPISEATRGHGTHTIAEVWDDYLKELLQSSDKAKL